MGEGNRPRMYRRWIFGYTAFFGGLLLLSSLLDPATVQAASSSSWDVGARPVASPNQAPISYFTFDLLPGESATGAISVDNYRSGSVPITIAPVLGVTALNSGDAYRAVTTPCQGSACWVQGLPTSQVLGPDATREYDFTVRVPTGTPSGQYLAGILVEPPLSAAASDHGGSTSFQVRVQQQVVLGVAVTVGPLGSLDPQLSIPLVTITTSPVLRLVAEVSNGGNSFDHPTAGLVYLRTPEGRTRTFNLAGGTVLPQGSADLDLNLGKLSSGTYPARVDLWYADHSKEAVWRGALVVPAVAATRTEHRQNTTLLITAGIPSWTWATIGVLGVLVLALLGALLVVTVRRRRREAA
ncbi:MAG: hypothetical protein WBZ07_03985 [Candidatus Dormiibacterota bacterium]